MRTTRSMVAVALLLAGGEAALAADIHVEQPWSRATPKGAGVGVGYLTIRNTGATADRLTGGSADFATGVEIHHMAIENGVMTMAEMPGGLEISAHGNVTLSPKGDHIMFQGLKRPLRKGESVTAVLTFAHAGPLTVRFLVGGIADTRPGGGKPTGGGMGGMKM